MSSEILEPVGRMLEDREPLRDFAEREDKRVGANADEMHTGFIDGERHFVKSDLPETEKAAHIAAAPLMNQFDHSPQISYDPDSGEVAVSKLGDDPRSPNSARLSDSLYSNLAPVDEDSFYEVAAERWVLGDANVYDNILVESVGLGDLMPGEERDVYLHDFDHAGKNPSKGRKRCFREAFEYVGEKLGIDFSMKRFQDEVGQLTQDLDLKRYRDHIQEMEGDLEDDLYQTVKEHGQVIENNIQYGREVY